MTHKDEVGNPIYTIKTMLTNTAVVDEKGKVSTSFAKKVVINDHKGHVVTVPEKDAPPTLLEKLPSAKFQTAVALTQNFKKDNDFLSPSQVIANNRKGYQDAVSASTGILTPFVSQIADFGTGMVAGAILHGAQFGASFLQTDPEKISINFNGN